MGMRADSSSSAVLFTAIHIKLRINAVLLLGEVEINPKSGGRPAKSSEQF